MITGNLRLQAYVPKCGFSLIKFFFSFFNALQFFSIFLCTFLVLVHPKRILTLVHPKLHFLCILIFHFLSHVPHIRIRGICTKIGACAYSRRFTVNRVCPNCASEKILWFSLLKFEKNIALNRLQVRSCCLLYTSKFAYRRVKSHYWL